MKIPFLFAAFLAAEFMTDAAAATKNSKKPQATPQQNAPAPKKNEYGPGCKNQGASIMSGGCVN
jgi:hypothetical protein